MATKQINNTAVCVKRIVWVDKKDGDEREGFLFAFEASLDVTFFVMPNKNLAPIVGAKYVPSLSVYQKAVLGKDNKPKIENKVSIAWIEL